MKASGRTICRMEEEDSSGTLAKSTKVSLRTTTSMEKARLLTLMVPAIQGSGKLASSTDRGQRTGLKMDSHSKATTSKERSTAKDSSPFPMAQDTQGALFLTTSRDKE